MTNIAENLTRTAARFADVVGIRADDTTLTWSQLDEASARFASYLRSQGIGVGDTVAMSLPNIPAFPVVAYGVWRAGAVLVPMNPMFMPREVEYYLGDSEAKLVVGAVEATEKATKSAGIPYLKVSEDQLSGLLHDHEPNFGVIERDGSETAVILYTSGTTGRPKGAELTHDGLNKNQEIVARTLLEVTRDDVLLGCLPLFHVFGLTCVLNVAVSTGAELTLIPRFEPTKVMEMVERDGVTVFVGVPTMYQAGLAVLDTKQYDISSLRLCVCGGSAMPVEVLKKVEKRFGANVLEGYGLSETSPVTCFNHPHRERKPGSIGVPIEEVEMKILTMDGGEAPVGEVGEVVISGSMLMKGYFKRPEATADAIRDGWFYSGDLGRQDDDGYFYIVDRSKDMIIRGGYNVYPREVEEVLYEHPDIAEVAVVGVPHEHYGEEVAAFVVRRPGSSLSAEDVQDFAKERVAAYKYPRKIEFIEALPKGATGKILKRELRS